MARRRSGRGEQRREDDDIATTQTQGTCHDMRVAQPRQQSIVDRLADLGEEAIQRIGNAPGGDRVLAAMAGTRDRLDDLQKRVRGLEGLDQRVAEMERRLEKLEGKGKSSTTRKSSSTTRKSSGSSSGSGSS